MMEMRRLDIAQIADYDLGALLLGFQTAGAAIR